VLGKDAAMTETVVYSYTAVNNGSSYTVNPDSEDAVATTVEELSPGDQFVVDGKVYSYLGGADAVVGGAEVGFFAIGRSGAIRFFSVSPIGHSEKLTLNDSQTFTICFMAGTLIATPAGPVRVEDLAVGDLVVTASGDAAPVRWIGRQTVSRVFANPARVLPVRIKAGALADNLPERDLLVSPCHSLLLDDILVQASALLNDTTIVRETNVPATFVYYHVELDDHALILAEGVPAETFVDNVDRLAFDNWDEHLRIYPEGHAVAELPFPRAASARQLPASIVARVAAREALSTGGLRNAA
jgi:hypothetical protein